MKVCTCFSITIFVSSDNEYLPVPNSHKFFQELSKQMIFRGLALLLQLKIFPNKHKAFLIN